MNTPGLGLEGEYSKIRFKKENAPGLDLEGEYSRFRFRRRIFQILV